MKEIITLFPSSYQKCLSQVFQEQRAEELRLRRGQALSIVDEISEKEIETKELSQEDLEFVLNRACEYSLHTVQNQIASGFVTLAGGHRLGICGTAVVAQGKVTGIRNLSSLSLRIARECATVPRNFLENLIENGDFQSTLIISPPAMGKTTLIRDLIRLLSSGEEGYRVSVVDERSEISGMYRGQSVFDLGQRTDILNACPKGQGMLFMLRSMSPQILAVDEITSSADVDAILELVGCGVKLLATAHGNDFKDLFRREIYKKLKNNKVFQRVITIQKLGAERHYQVEKML